MLIGTLTIHLGKTLSSHHIWTFIPSVRLSVCPSVHLSVRLFVRLFICPSVRLSVRPFVHLSIHPTVPLPLQSYPSLLRAVLRSAYLAVLRSLALLASVSQGQVSSTKALLCLPCTDRSTMTRSGLCAYTMTSAGIDPAVFGLVPQLDAGVVEGQDLQEVHVKDSEVRILWLSVMDDQGGFYNSNVADCRFRR